MEKITFNGLGLNFYINQIAIKFHNISIYWYAIFIVLAFIVGIALCRKDNGKYNIKFENILELAIIMIPVAIISARIYFILFKLEYYIQNPSEILDIRNIWRNNRCNYNYYDLLQKKGYKHIRYVRLYSSLFSIRTGNRKMGKFL